MRIIAGKHRGRRLYGTSGSSIRATRAQVRESVFNILDHGPWQIDGVSPLRGRTILDACCGTGALGLEALSRGAERCFFLDSSRTAIRLTTHNAEQLDESARVHVICHDVTCPPPAVMPCMVTFLDPPYNHPEPTKIVTALDEAGWIASDGLVVIEMRAALSQHWPHCFTLLDCRRYRHTVVYFLQRKQVTYRTSALHSSLIASSG